MRHVLFLALMSTAVFLPQAAQAQSDEVFGSRSFNSGDSMTVEEYNNVPPGLLLPPEVREKMAADEAKKKTAPVDPNAPPVAAAPAPETGTTTETTTPATADMPLRTFDEILKIYRQGDFAGTKASLDPLVRSGHAGALELMGIMLRMGQGVDKDPVKAFELLSRAAETGRPLAQHHLGSMYFNGEGTDKDLTQALKWTGLAVIYYPDGPEKKQATSDRDNIFLQATRRDRDGSTQLQREWLNKRGEGHLLDLQ